MARGNCKTLQNGDVAQPCSTREAWTGFQWTKRTVIVLLTVTLAVLLHGSSYALLAPFFPLEAQLKGNTVLQYGLVFGVCQLTSFLTSPIYGKLLSHHVRAKTMLCVGTFVMGTCCCLMGLLHFSPPGTTFFGLAMATRIVQYLGSTAMYTCCYAVACAEFSDHIEVIAPLIETSFGLGVILGPSIGGLLYEEGGFVLPFVSMGSAAVLLAIIAGMFFPDIERRRDFSTVTMKDLYDWRLLANLSVVVACFVTSGFNEATLTMHLQQFHLAPGMIGLIFMIAGASFSIASFAFGRASKHVVDPRRLCIIGSAFYLACFAVIGPLPFLNFSPTVPVICVSQLLIGVGLASHYICTFMHSIKQAVEYKRLPNNLSTFALLSGAYCSVASLGLFAGPIVGGVLLDNVGYSWGTVFVFSLHAAVLALLLLSIACDRAQHVQHDEKEPILKNGRIQRDHCTDKRPAVDIQE